MRLGQLGLADRHERREQDGQEHRHEATRQAHGGSADHPHAEQLTGAHAERSQGGVLARLDKRGSRQRLAEHERSREHSERREQPQREGLGVEEAPHDRE